MLVTQAFSKEISIVSSVERKIQILITLATIMTLLAPFSVMFSQKALPQQRLGMAEATEGAGMTATIGVEMHVQQAPMTLRSGLASLLLLKTLLLN